MENTQQSASGAQKQLFIKLAFILVLILFLLVPVMWIRDMIYERENLQRQVEEEIAWSWGRAQTVTGPVLCIPFEKTVSYDGKTNNIENHFLYLTPEETKAEVKAATETRSKGIFNTVVFDAGNQLTGSFNLQNMPVDKNIKYLYGEAVLITGISDPEAVTGKVTFLWNGEEAKTIPGPGLTHFTTSGFHNPVIISPATEAYTFSLNFDLRGTTAINFLPSGKNSRIKTSSNWPSPSFTGKNLPRQREISGEGFIADWVSNE